MTAKNLGEILIEQGIINREALDRALQIQNRRLGEILIEERLADPVAIAQALQFQARARRPKRLGRLSVDVQAFDSLLARLEALEDQLRQKNATPTPVLASVLSIRESLELLLLEPVDTLFARAKAIVAQAVAETGKQIELFAMAAGSWSIDRWSTSFATWFCTSFAMRSTTASKPLKRALPCKNRPWARFESA